MYYNMMGGRRKTPRNIQKIARKLREIIIKSLK